MICKNCNQPVEENFCTHCGQSIKVDKLRLSTFLSEVSAGVFQVNKGFFYTLKELFIRPGHSIREYLAGKRVKYFKPVAYVFTVSTVYYLLSQWLGQKTFLDDLITGFANGANGDDEVESIIKYITWFASHYAYTILLTLPVYAFASYLAFIRSGYSYLEHVVLNAYITAQQAVIYLFTVALGWVVGSESVGASLGLIGSLGYTFYVFWYFFCKKKKGQVIFLTLLTYLISMVLFAVVVYFSGYFLGLTLGD